MLVALSNSIFLSLDFLIWRNILIFATVRFKDRMTMEESEKKPKRERAKKPKVTDDKKLIRFDWAMKYMLRSPANFDVLEGLLSAVLGEKIKIVDILESEGDKKEQDEKFNRVDIRCKNSKGHIIIIEVQNTSEADYIHRILFGVSQAVVRHIDEGKHYAEIPKVYSISIIYFKLGNGSDYVYRGKYEFTGLHNQEALTFTEKDKKALGLNSPSDPMPETYFLMVKDFDKVAKTPLEEWMRFLKDGVIDPDTKDKGLKAARHKLDYMKMSRDEQDRYMRYYCDANSFTYTQAREKEIAREEGIAIGKEEGIAIGKEEGIAIGNQNAKNEIARNMKAMGLSASDIAKCTGLTEEEITKL